MHDGIAEDRFHRIEGAADHEALIPTDPHDPRNRWISVSVMD
jgi:chemotaxis protein MotB